MSELWTPPGSMEETGHAGSTGMVDCEFEPYDTEIIKIERVMAELSQSIGTVRSYESFADEVITRFGDIGIEADVLITDVDGTGIPHITLVRRLEKHEFDHEKQAWEVQHDILGIDDNPGTIQPDGSVRSPTKSTSLHIPKE